jgi:hypothetical protein
MEILKMETSKIAVPVTLVSLSAAIGERLNSLGPESPPSDVLALIRLSDEVDAALDWLAQVVGVPRAISTHRAA